MNKDVLIQMRFTPTGHNSIYTDHLEILSDTLIEICPVDSKQAIPILGACVGMSDRFVKEHLRRFEATGVIQTKKGIIHWMLPGGKKEKIPESPLQKDVRDITESDKVIESDNVSIYPNEDKPLDVKKCPLSNPENHFKYCDDKKGLVSCHECGYFHKNR